MSGSNGSRPGEPTTKLSTPLDTRSGRLVKLEDLYPAMEMYAHAIYELTR